LKKFLLVLLLFVIAVPLIWVFTSGSGAVEIPFARVGRETLVSTVRTNGKVEPREWIAVRAATEGVVRKIHAENGDVVAKDALIATIDVPEARVQLAAAQARIAEAESELRTLERGGRKSQLVAIENELATANEELETATRELAVVERLRARQAATGLEVEKAEERVRKARLRVESLQRRREALVSPVDRRAAQARLRAAEADAERARRRIEAASLRAPMGGLLYQLDVRPGAYVRTGDLVAKIGTVNQARVVVYVDEPDLGRVARGMPVTITWDALPGRQWHGTVEKTPAEIVALGTRKVGRVIALIENAGDALPPGANIDAEIRSRVVAHTLAIPKEALRRVGGQIGVFLLRGNTVRWRPVKLGISSITRAEVVEGLADGDAVALPSATPLQDGQLVSPVFP